MEKDWLIRTHHNQILGPVSKEKIKYLINENTLTGEDEITCGNGFWFKIKEKELVEKYIFGDFVQSFDPIGEAEDVLTAPEKDDLSKKLSIIPIFVLIFSYVLLNIPSSHAQSNLEDNTKKKIFKTPYRLI
jgi:hypothetical protein